MKSIHVLAIAPYEGLSNFFLNCVKSFPGISLNVLTGNLRAALQDLQKYDDYDIVISRGGTAQLLREKLVTPVIEVEVSVYDMLRVIKMAQQTRKNFVIIGFPNMIRASETICDILQFNMPTVVIHSEEDADQAIKELQEKGIELIIGDVITTDVARRLGIDSLLITSGVESVEKAFGDALQLFQNMEKIQHAIPYQAMLDHAPCQIALFDSQNKMIYSNAAFADMAPEEYGAILKENISRIDAGHAARFHRRHGSFSHDIVGVKLGNPDACWYAMYITSSANVMEHEACVQIKNPEYGQALSSGPEFLGAEKARAMIDKAILCGKGQTPVIILGGAGTGVEAFALYIHSAGAFRSSLFITVDCESLTEKTWQDIVNNADSPVHNLKHTIFFHNIHMLAYSIQKPLYYYMEDTLLTKRHHVLASSATDLSGLLSQNKFLPELYNKLGGFSVRLPSLDECPEEIPKLASLYISRYNMEFAKQVIGFTDEALEYLKAYHWERNLEQFKNAIFQFMVSADKSYISLPDVQAVLVPAGNRDTEMRYIDLSKTFAEIERDVINQVLAEENMNQSRVAKRLGIGRSTLWRKMSN